MENHGDFSSAGKGEGHIADQGEGSQQLHRSGGGAHSNCTGQGGGVHRRSGLTAVPT